MKKETWEQKQEENCCPEAVSGVGGVSFVEEQQVHGIRFIPMEFQKEV